MKRIIQKSISSLLALTLATSCATSIKEKVPEKWQRRNPIHQLFRSNENLNQKPITEAIEIDYSEHDKENKKVIVNDRAFKTEESAPPQTLEKIIQVPQTTRYKISSINATYIENTKDEIIMKYGSRIPSPDLIKLITPHLEDIELKEGADGNLILHGTKESFGDFTHLTSILNEFDVAPAQIRVQLKLLEFFADNTYDRESILNILKNGVEAYSLNLPSSSDPKQTLTTGIQINPFYNHPNNTSTYHLDGIFKFLDSHGKTNTLAAVDALVSNGKPFTFKNQAEIPYEEITLVGNNVVESVKYKPTGIDLNVTPYANEQGFITLKIEKAESGEATGYVGKVQLPIFRTADFNSEFIVRDGIPYFAVTSLFTRYRSVDRGVPLVNKIPLMKHITSSRSIENNQSQLILMIEARELPRNSNIGTQRQE